MQEFKGIDYLRIDIANSFGMDKKNWEPRLQWFADNEPVLEKLIHDADEPAQFMAGVLAYRKAMQREATGYMVGLDATASGIQILSALSGCIKSAATCNLVNTGNREDSYTIGNDRMNVILQKVGIIPRDDSKYAIMTSLYGSKAVPKEIFGEDTPELAAFYEMLKLEFPGVSVLNDDLINLWQSNALAHCWALPDGFDVRIKVMGQTEHNVAFNGKGNTIKLRQNIPQETGISLGANIVHSIDGFIVREMARRCNYDTENLLRISELDYESAGSKEGCDRFERLLVLWNSSAFFSTEILDYIDQSNLGRLTPNQFEEMCDVVGMMLEHNSFDLITIHDCFKFHANYGNAVRKHYREIMAQLAESTMLPHIATFILGRRPNVMKLSTNLGELIRESEYAIC